MTNTPDDSNNLSDALKKVVDNFNKKMKAFDVKLARDVAAAVAARDARPTGDARRGITLSEYDRHFLKWLRNSS